MIKIWLKIIKNDKIIHNISEVFYDYNPNNLNNYLEEMCNTIDVPTPIVVFSKANTFDLFNIATFTSSDFIEKINFDKMIIENITGK